MNVINNNKTPHWLFLYTVICWTSTTMLYDSCQAIEIIYPCDSKIYCQGPILESVHRAKLFESDSKDYVDMSLKRSPEETLQAFVHMFPNSSSDMWDKEEHRARLRQFLKDYFNDKGSELIDHKLVDFKENPPAIANISDSTYKMWALLLNFKWSKLSKRIKDEVRHNPASYSILELPNPFIVPGGRFREIYYWDTYWIIKGLLHCDMYETVRGMIENYLVMVDKYGLIPNGGRVYYLQRSQPPYLAYMMDEYYEFTKNKTFLTNHVLTLEKELVGFWEAKRSFFIDLKGQSYRVFHFNTLTNVPRPESHKEDIAHAVNLPNEDKANLYSNIASSAESGWDFSSRWFQDKNNMRTHKTRTILPVDLNAVMCGNYRILAKFFRLTNSTERSQIYQGKHEACIKTMMDVFYNETHGVWFDYHLDMERHNVDFFPSNLAPLFTRCYSFDNMNETLAMKKILLYLKESKALNYGDGVPTSMNPTGQQWDWPNAWAPLVHMVVEGLHNTDDHRLQTVGSLIAEHWTRHNYVQYAKTNHMYEKYDIINGVVASGGEYEVQEGFGWTNGVILDLLVKYGSGFVFEKQLDHHNLFKDVQHYFE